MQNEPTIEMDQDGISIQEGMELVLHFFYMRGIVHEGELWFNHWFGDGEGDWFCIDITDGEIMVV